MTDPAAYRETNVPAYSTAQDRDPTDEEMLGLYSIYRAGGLNVVEPLEDLYRKTHPEEFENTQAKAGIIERIRNLGVVRRLLG